MSASTVAIVPTTATNVPPTTNNQPNNFSDNGSEGPNNLRFASAGKITLTMTVHINPTSEHKNEKLGNQIATASARKMSTIFTTESTNSIARSLGNMFVSISSNPSANGNIVRVNLLHAVNIMSQVRQSIAKFPSPARFSSDIVI
mmetsp:Transcript_22190/g.33630  ORF Transcript_22190/g.33630 Transcript_22190/m.33630 type:complete len:145 (-) Transcript_22190:684-1118(-)